MESKSVKLANAISSLGDPAMKWKYVVTAAVVGASLGLLSIGWAQNEGAQLDPVLENLRDIKSKLDTKGSQKSSRVDVIPSAHQTRGTEEAASEIARLSQQFAASVGGGMNAKAIYGPDDRRN